MGKTAVCECLPQTLFRNGNAPEPRDLEFVSESQDDGALCDAALGRGTIVLRSAATASAICCLREGLHMIMGANSFLSLLGGIVMEVTFRSSPTIYLLRMLALPLPQRLPLPRPLPLLLLRRRRRRRRRLLLLLYYYHHHYLSYGKGNCQLERLAIITTYYRLL